MVRIRVRFNIRFRVRVRVKNMVEVRKVFSGYGVFLSFNTVGGGGGGGGVTGGNLSDKLPNV